LLAEPLYPGDGCRLNVGEAISNFQQIAKRGRMSQSVISDLYAFMHKSLLPLSNKMPASSREAAKLLAAFGTGYQISPCCRNDCNVFTGRNELAEECPDCKESVLIDNKPVKQFRHVSLIATLQQLFQTQHSAKLMHAPATNTDILCDIWGELFKPLKEEERVILNVAAVLRISTWAENVCVL
jgi:hypothetical protein